MVGPVSLSDLEAALRLRDDLSRDLDKADRNLRSGCNCRCCRHRVRYVSERDRLDMLRREARLARVNVPDECLEWLAGQGYRQLGESLHCLWLRLTDAHKTKLDREMAKRFGVDDGERA